MQSPVILAAQNPFHPLLITSHWDKAKQIVSAVAIPILIGVGAVLCATSFFPQAFVGAAVLKSFSNILPILTNSATYGLGILALGVMLYVKQIFAFTHKNQRMAQEMVEQHQETIKQHKKQAEDKLHLIQQNQRMAQEMVEQHQETVKQHKKQAEDKLHLIQLGFDISESQLKETEEVVFPTVTCQLTNYELNAGSIKQVFLASSVQHTGCLAVSKLEDNDPSKFDIYALSEEVFAVWKRVAAQNPHGGLGQIIDKKIVHIQGQGRVQYLVQPFFNRGNLFDRLQSGLFDHEQRVNIALDLMRALASMHENKLVHGDITPTNIQLHFGGHRLGAFLIDTDTAFIQAEGASSQFKRIVLGAPITWAPEMFASDDANLQKLDRLKTDVWSMGLIFMMLFVKTPQFLLKLHEKIGETAADKDKLRLHFRVDMGMTTPPKAAKEFSKWLKWDTTVMLAPEFDKVKPVLMEMLQPSPTKRIDAKEALCQLEVALTVAV